MKIIDGNAIAQKIHDKIAEAITHINARKPGLAFLLIGDNPASHAYIRMKKKRCEEIGILSFDREFPENVAEDDLLAEIYALNNNPNVDGILIQQPIPKHISTPKVIGTICPQKDVDGFHPLNIGKVLLGEKDGFFPCTPYGVVVLLAQSQIQVEGKHIVILGRSNIVGKPLAAMLMQKGEFGNATVTVAHSLSKNLKELCRSADILIAAIGKPKFITKDMVKEGAVVIDVGINRIIDPEKKYRLVGDVDFEEVAPLCSHITPVPGGVGPMTIAMLLSNTLLSFQKRQC